MSSINVRLRQLSDDQLRTIADSMAIMFSPSASNEAMIITISNAASRNATKRASINKTIDRLTGYNNRQMRVRSVPPPRRRLMNINPRPMSMLKTVGINPNSLTNVGSKCSTSRYDMNYNMKSKQVPRMSSRRMSTKSMLSSVGMSQNDLKVSPVSMSPRVSSVPMVSSNSSVAPVPMSPRVSSVPMSPKISSGPRISPVPISPRISSVPMVSSNSRVAQAPVSPRISSVPVNYM